MFIKRRDMCLLLPAVFFPAVMRPEGVAAQEGSMPSAMYRFEKLSIRTPNNAQIRDVLKLVSSPRHSKPIVPISGNGLTCSLPIKGYVIDAAG